MCPVVFPGRRGTSQTPGDGALGGLAEGTLAGVGMPERLALAFSGSACGRVFADPRATSGTNAWK